MNKNKNIKDLAERMKVVMLNQGSWSPQRLHKGESYQENLRHGVHNEAKVIVCVTKHPALQEALKIKANIYNQHKRLTLPSPCDGIRIVPLGREWEHSSTMKSLGEKFNEAVSEFINSYDEVIEKAQKSLNTLFDHQLFPPKPALRQRFYNNVRYMECPHEGQWGTWLNETLEVGQLELQERINKAARHMIDRCNGDGKLYASVIENLSDICDLAGDFNLMDDPIIANAARELKKVTKDYDIDVLRDSELLRKDAASRVDSILASFPLKIA